MSSNNIVFLPNPSTEYTAAQELIEQVFIIRNLGCTIPLKDNGITTEEFIRLVDGNRLKGIDLDDVGFDVGLYKQVARFISDTDPENSSVLLHDMNTAFSTEAMIANLKDKVTQDVDNADRCIAIPREGVESILFPDGKNLDLIQTIEVFDFITGATEAKLRITLVNGSQVNLLIKRTQASGTAATGQITLKQDVVGFLDRASSQDIPFGEDEMRAQFDKLQSAILGRHQTEIALCLTGSGALVFFGSTVYVGSHLGAQFTEVQYASRYGLAGVIVGFVLMAAPVLFLGTKDQSVLSKIDEQGLDYFKQFENAESYMKALNQDSDMKALMKHVWWREQHVVHHATKPTLQGA